MIKNKNLELLCDLNMKIANLINKKQISILELEELELPDRGIIEFIEDMNFDPYYYKNCKKMK